MTDGEIRFVVAKNYNGGTNWAISSPFTHSVGTNQFNTVNTLSTYQELSWYNYNPANAWSVGNVGTQLATPYPGDAILAGFRLSAAGIALITLKQRYLGPARLASLEESGMNMIMII